MRKGAVPRGTDEAKVIKVIVTKSIKGAGIDEKDPVRFIYQYWSLKGKLLAERDDYLESINSLSSSEVKSSSR